MQHIRLHTLKTNYLSIIYVLVWLTPFGIVAFHNNNSETISVISQSIQTIVHVVIIYYSIKIYLNSIPSDKHITIWFVVIAVFFFLNDFSYFFFLDIQPKLSFLGSSEITTAKRVINNSFSIIWLISTIIILSKILLKYIISVRGLSAFLGFLLIVNAITVTSYLFPIHLKVDIFTAHNLFLEISILIESIIFDLAILCLIYVRNRGALLLLAGLIIIMSGEFLTAYRWIVNVEVINVGLSESLWLLGLIAVMIGISSIHHTQSFIVSDWFGSGRSIKSRLTLGTFIISYSCCIFLYISAGIFHLIKEQAFIWMPLVSMLYSVVVVILSLHMGKVFENHFIIIKENINNFLSNRLKYNDLGKYEIDEFVLLHKFILNVFELKEQQNLLRKKFGDIAGQAVHDLGSPIKALHVAIRELREQGIDTEALNLDLCVNRLHEYQTSILSYYRKIPDEEQPSNKIADINIDKYILINNLINSIIEFKRIEWANSPCIIKISTTKDCENLWIKLNAIQFERCLSNLLNNAYESLNKPERVIEVHLYQLTSKLTLEIIDNGCGIPAHMVKQVMLGYSTKHPGKGLGLSGAKEYFNQLNGSLDIFPNDSNDENCGTKIIISIPIINKPKWYFDTINYCHNEIFVILDDDVTVIKQWQKLLLTKGIKFKLFLTVEEYQNWLLNINDLSFGYILISDYDLNNIKTGVDIIKECPFEKKYLITGLADTSWLQSICTDNIINLAHICHIPSINLILS